MRITRRILLCGLALAGLASLSLSGPTRSSLAEEAPSKKPETAFKSGLQVGEKVPTFYVRAVTGSLKNKSVCYVCRNGERPVVMVFTHQVTPELAKLLKGVDDLADKHRADGLRAFGIFISRDNQELLPQVQTLAFNEMLGLPLTLAAAPSDGLALHPDAAVTVVLYRDLTVTDNFAFRAGDLNEKRIGAVLESIRRLATTDPPNGAN